MKSDNIMWGQRSADAQQTTMGTAPQLVDPGEQVLEARLWDLRESGVPRLSHFTTCSTSWIPRDFRTWMVSEIPEELGRLAANQAGDRNR